MGTNKITTANTYASCGRDDPARKRRLNRIPFCRNCIQRAWRRKSSFIMEIATGFDELPQERKVKRKDE